MDKNKCIAAQGTRRGGIYALGTIGSEFASEVACTAGADLSMWHDRLGHAR
jgi:hypothetical protein